MVALDKRDHPGHIGQSPFHEERLCYDVPSLRVGDAELSDRGWPEFRQLFLSVR
ncbi:MAG: hypothetical protein IGR92_02400 [Leptolyngbyaceae cyanobacterium T60_A2020_046]|nr:hypothetical protein [Leptolyngbyaceae cyanobacterium T60_A2020_046]